MDVLLYSKFSQASKKLMLQLQQTPELLESLTITCIDNKLIRKQILSDEKVKINHLPCFIRLNDQTGNFDIYEGQNAFDFFTTLQTQFQQPVSQNYNFTQPQPPIPPKYQEPENEIEYENEPIQPPMPQKQTKQNIKQKAQQEESQRHQSELKDMKRKEEFIKNQSKDTNRKAPPTVKNKLSTSLKTVTFTPIEDLELENLQDIDELEDEEKDGENDEKDEKESSTSISTYTHIPKNTNSEFSEREVRSKQAEINASKNTGSILSKAMKMQKERA